MYKYLYNSFNLTIQMWVCTWKDKIIRIIFKFDSNDRFFQGWWGMNINCPIPHSFFFDIPPLSTLYIHLYYKYKALAIVGVI